MIKIENIEVHGIEPAIRGMRNPKNSWSASDSDGDAIGEKDMRLMSSLALAGSEHRKFDRMIVVYMDITAPIYWWKEFDTYKVGTVANSCSTMHKIHEKPFSLKDFSIEHLDTDAEEIIEKTVDLLNELRDIYVHGRNSNYVIIKPRDKDYWWQMIQLLPSSYNQRRTVMMNYEVAHRIVEQRSNHKLDEWHTLCDELHKLPYFDEIFEGAQSRNGGNGK